QSGLLQMLNVYEPSAGAVHENARSGLPPPAHALKSSPSLLVSVPDATPAPTAEPRSVSAQVTGVIEPSGPIAASSSTIGASSGVLLPAGTGSNPRRPQAHIASRHHLTVACYHTPASRIADFVGNYHARSAQREEMPRTSFHTHDGKSRPSRDRCDGPVTQA